MALHARLEYAAQRIAAMGSSLQRFLSFSHVSGVEVAAEIYDLLNEDLRRFYSDIISSSCVKLVELQDHILSTYDREIADYASNLFSR